MRLVFCVNYQVKDNQKTFKLDTIPLRLSKCADFLRFTLERKKRMVMLKLIEC